MSDPVLVYKGEAIAAYGFGDPHPFGIDRHNVFHLELAEADLDGAIRYEAPRRATVDELLLFHTADYIDRVSRMSQEGKGYLDDGDTPAMPGIFDAASDVVGTTLAAVDAVMRGEAKRAFVPIAGLHHAARGTAAGFCVFNDCGVAAEYLRHKHGVQRVAYVDIDAHHGDGMFYGFEDDPDLIFADIHEDGRYLYPGTGAAEETGTGRARGTKLNIPLAPGADDAEFRMAWRGGGAAGGAASKPISTRRNPSSSCSNAAPTASRAIRLRTCAIPSRPMRTRQLPFACSPTSTVAAASWARVAVAITAKTWRAHGRASYRRLPRLASN
jgi:acetoin utilization protein AcuC